MDVLDLVLHLLAQLLVERAERLVHQHELGLEDQRAGDRDPLLLAARELGRPAVAEGVELDHLERPAHPVPDLGFGELPDRERKGQVLANRHVREQGIVLEHHADPALVRRHVVDRLAVQDDPAMGRGLEAREQHQAGGLARARRPEQGQELATGDVEVQVLDDQALAVVGLLHVLETDVGLVLHPGSLQRSRRRPGRALLLGKSSPKNRRPANRAGSGMPTGCRNRAWPTLRVGLVSSLR